MEKWSIKPAPTPSDPLRYRLLVKGSMKDISALLRRFGALCGRPSAKNTPEGFDYSLPLHGVTAATMERLERALNEMQAAVTSAAAEPPAPSKTPVPPLPAAAEVKPAEPAGQLFSLEPPAPASLPEAAAPAARSANQSESVQESFGVALATDPAQSFDTLLVGPYNRFAHAAATAVVSTPGTMYNPLFLHGAPGVGKTHCLHAISQGLAGAMGRGSVVLTSGYRLSNAVSQALSAGRYKELREALFKAKALLVDNVHLTSVTEQNRTALVELFAHFFSNNLQVVMVSLYPPRALSGLEEALKISLTKGWAVDFKVPNTVVQVEIIQSWLDRHKVPLTADDSRMFLERMGAGYGECLAWMKRMEGLIKLWQKLGKTIKPIDIMNILFDPGASLTDFPTPQELAAAAGFAPPSPDADALNLALILPKGHEGMAGWVLKAFYQAAKQQSVTQNYRHVLTQVYDASQPFGVPFQLGEFCQSAKARAVLVIGPPNDSQLAAKANEFQHAVWHVLDSIDMSCAWVGHRSTMASAPFLRAHLDFISCRP